MNPRLLILFCSILYCAFAFSQHPYSSGERSPFYWALVGGIAAALWYVMSLVLGNYKGILIFFQRKMGKNKNLIKQKRQETSSIDNPKRIEEHQMNSLSENL